MSNFDPAMFLDATTDQALEKRPPITVGDYVSVIKKVDMRQWIGKQDPTKTGFAIDVQHVLEIPREEQERVGLDKPELTLRDSVMVDTVGTGAAASIDWAKGKNNHLRKYREALGMNTPGEKFSIRMMEGRPCRVKVSHEEYQGMPVERIDSVAAL